MSLVCAVVINSHAQNSSRIQINISIPNTSEIGVSIKQRSPTKSWSFKNTYAGATGLGERIQQLQASRMGKPVDVKPIASGEFRSEIPADGLTYRVNVSTRRTGDLAHVSWLTTDFGLLMMADLLPGLSELSTGALVEFELPAEWSVKSSVLANDRNQFLIEEPEKMVFFAGRGLRATAGKVRNVDVSLITNGAWAFDDKSVLSMGSRVLEDYFDLTQFRLRGRPTILLVPFPLMDMSSEWKAETRGSTVVLVLNQRASIRNWKGLLGVIFTHELFHLWVPNSLILTGDYDWFFEGFTMYVALQEALNLKLIRFQEYLDTLGRVYDSYLSKSDNQTLLEASESRWTTSNTVYDKGMFVAFMYDLLWRRESSNTRSFRDLYSSLFAKFADEPASANDVIIRALTSTPATLDFAKSYIEGKNPIQPKEFLAGFGIEFDSSSSRSRVTVRKELTNDQKKLLRSLGYRN